jgi:DNA-binding Xre family transcriptional regulator
MFSVGCHNRNMPKARKPDIRPRRQAHIYLAEWLDHRDMNAEDLAAKLDTSKSVISKLMSGKQRYNRDWLEEIAYQLQCDVPDLFGPPLPADAEKLLAKLSPGRRKTAINVIENLIEEQKTGTKG